MLSYFYFVLDTLSNLKKYFNFFKKVIDNLFNIWYSIKSLLKERFVWKMFFENWAKRQFELQVYKLNSKILYIFWRVWSWLRMNAGGMPKTCKSNEVAHWRWSACTKLEMDFHLVADGWVTRGWPAFKMGITVGNDC